ncbi:dihydropteroate synthase, partial [bacterium]
MDYRIRFITPGKEEITRRNLLSTGIDEHGIEILLSKSKIHIVRVEGLTAPAANILKQQLLSLGADAAVHRDTIRGETFDAPVLIISDERRLEALPSKLEHQPFKLKSLAADIVSILERIKKPPTEIPLPGGSIDLGGGPIIMGILNVTPDSFSDGGLYNKVPRAVERALEMVEEGASIIDVGGESSRPGAAELGPEEEKARVVPVIEALAERLDVPISIDTRKADVAEAAIRAGAELVNDISALR